MSVVPLITLRPYWLPGRFSLAMIGTNLFCRILASTLPAMDSSVILDNFSSQTFHFVFV